MIAFYMAFIDDEDDREKIEIISQNSKNISVSEFGK